MEIYPAIELKGGCCVSLRRGRLAEPQHWDNDPLQVACDLADAGAHWLHLTDFDAIEGDPRNAALVSRIIHETAMDVQLGGGIRSLEQVEHWIDAGAARVVLGTMALDSPELLRRAAKYFPDQIVLALDISRGRVLTEGWTRLSPFLPETVLPQFEGDPLAAVLVTDVDADIGDAERSASLFTGLARRTRHPLIASGGIATLDDLARLHYAGGLSGAVIGRALMAGAIALPDALRLAAEHPRKAEFI